MAEKLQPIFLGDAQVDMSEVPPGPGMPTFSGSLGEMGFLAGGFRQEGQDEAAKGAAKQEDLKKRYLKWVERTKEVFDYTEIGGHYENGLLNNRKVTRAYAKLYLDNPRIFVWAGLAAVASNLVGQVLMETFPFWWKLHKGTSLDVFLRRLGEAGMGLVAGFLSPHPIAGAFIGAILAPEGAEEREKLKAELYMRFVDGNRAIFLNVYWQHLAFLDGYNTGTGTKELEDMAAGGYLDKLALDGWKLVAKGLPTGESPKGDWDLVLQGSAKLVDYEQRVILQPFFKASRFAMRLASFWVHDPLKDWGLSSSPDFGLTESYANPTARMKYINGYIIPAWNEAVTKKPERVKAVLQGISDLNK